MRRDVESAWPDALPQPGLSLGLVVCAPLFLCYELGLAMGGPEVGRSGAELVLGLALAPAGGMEPVLRWGGIALLLAWAALRVRRFEEAPASAIGAKLGEGLVAGVALGPLLIAMIGVFDAPELVWNLPAGRPVEAPTLARACRLLGASVWEELLFRVAAYGITFLFVARTLHFLGVARGVAGWIGEMVALLGSSVLFAAFHLAALQPWPGGGGEPFDAAVFLWRLLAGLLLAALFRWRGLGVCAWAHGLFNLALALGAGPGVFRSG
jgi:hypothetical protein